MSGLPPTASGRRLSIRLLAVDPVMPKVKKRKPDMRRIRPSKTYTMPEISESLDRNIATIRRWIQNGLPRLDGARPVLIDGAALRDWLKGQWIAKKQSCGPGELFCFKCRAPRKPVFGSVTLEPRNAKTLSIRALCGVCGTPASQCGSLKKRAEIEACFCTLKPVMPRLAGYGDTSDKVTFRKQKRRSSEKGVGGNQMSIVFEPHTGGDQGRP
jgi:hypothetical protein